MGWFGDDSDYVRLKVCSQGENTQLTTPPETSADAYNQVVNAPHKAALSHELIAGAASYEASKAWENYQAKEGKPDSDAQAKEIVAGLAGAFIDDIVESKGLGYIDKERVKHHARH